MSLRVSTSSALISACSGLMYSQRADHRGRTAVNSVCSVSRWSIALATPKSITLGTGLPSCKRDQHVGRLDVAVDDPFLVGVLDRLADRRRKFAAARGRQLVVVAVLGDRHALDQFHDEVGPAGVGGAGVEDPGDVGVVHQGQRLPLGLEAGDDLPLSMPGLMIFRATLRRTGSSCSAM